MSEASLQSEMTHRMTVSQSMQQGMRILQASSIELGQIVRQALESNPVLEEEPQSDPRGLEDENFRDRAEIRDDGWSELTHEGYRSPDAAMKRDFLYKSIVAPESLKSHLTEQAQHSALEGRSREALFHLIDALDDRGYLTDSVDHIAENACFSRKNMSEALEVLHGMDPAGVGATDLQDSLLIQLAQNRKKGSLAYRIIRLCWNELVAHKYIQIEEKLGVSQEKIAVALDMIRHLNPNPGSIFAPSHTIQIRPDLIVTEERNGALLVELSSEYLPKLRLNPQYMEMLSENAEDRELRQYLRHAVRDGQELIRTLEQRQETILRLGRVVLRRQEAYFRLGPSYLKAMKMEEVAEEMGVHVTTVSRACRDKYLLSRWGIKELRTFFRSGVNSSGDEKEKDGLVSSEAVRELLKMMIDEEDKAKPLSDAALSEALKNKGINVARRTVTKYREQMKLLPASLRKTLR